MGNSYVLFFSIFIIVILFEYDFCTKDHINCHVPIQDKDYTELFCMARTQNLRSYPEGAYLRNYGRWQFYIIIQMFIAAVACRIDLKIRELIRVEDERSTIGRRYILTVCILLSIIVCWTLTYLSLGGYFNQYIWQVLYHAVDVREVPSPIVTMFPPKVECHVQPLTSNETYTATCSLPLHSSTPFYYLALFVIYVVCLLYTINSIVSLAVEKIKDSKRCSRAREYEMKIFGLSTIPDTAEKEEKTEPRQWEPIDKIVARLLKKLTKPKSKTATSNSDYHLIPHPV